ncbi:hypothetical protein JTE90_020633 [Oedothorax gibbosus]|uniref:Uncharacterized protein n=1 Tax=Oedothorax gibbosus TaxID=931172 RepID=A0AAV6TTK6_9ARAC|nr:hypothetical protein JTE90_020633 [Oedothorax gibbosus]
MSDLLKVSSADSVSLAGTPSVVVSSAAARIRGSSAVVMAARLASSIRKESSKKSKNLDYSTLYDVPCNVYDDLVWRPFEDLALDLVEVFARPYSGSRFPVMWEKLAVGKSPPSEAVRIVAIVVASRSPDTRPTDTGGFGVEGGRVRACLAGLVLRGGRDVPDMHGDVHHHQAPNGLRALGLRRVHHEVVEESPQLVSLLSEGDL